MVQIQLYLLLGWDFHGLRWLWLQYPISSNSTNKKLLSKFCCTSLFGNKFGDNGNEFSEALLRYPLLLRNSPSNHSVVIDFVAHRILGTSRERVWRLKLVPVVRLNSVPLTRLGLIRTSSSYWLGPITIGYWFCCNSQKIVFWNKSTERWNKAEGLLVIGSREPNWIYNVGPLVTWMFGTRLL